MLPDRNKNGEIQTDQSLSSRFPFVWKQRSFPVGRARKQVLIPPRRGCAGGGQRQAGGRTEKLLLICAASTSASANCSGPARDLCVDSDMSSRMMPQPAPVTPRTGGAACVAMIRLLAFISSGLPETLRVFIPTPPSAAPLSPLPSTIVPLEKIEARGMMQMCAPLLFAGDSRLQYQEALVLFFFSLPPVY